MSIDFPTILQIIPQLETGGAELSTIEIAEAVVHARGTAIVLTQGGRMAPRLSEVGAEFIPFAAATKNPALVVWNAKRICDIATSRSVSLIHARSRAPAWSALIAARWLGLPFVTTYHGAYKEASRIKNLYNSVMARSDIVIANSRYTADVVTSRYHTPPERLRIIYRGVDAPRYDPTAVGDDRVAAMRLKWGVGPRTRVILHAARLTAWKGQTDLIATAARMRTRLRDVVFILAGDAQGRNAYRAELERQIDDNRLRSVVRLVGHIDDMPAAFAAAHVAFVASIEPEAFGRAAAEAQAIGCPVISTDIGAPPETVMAPPRVLAGQRTGWLVAPGDLAGYEQALDEVLALTAAQRSAVGERARAHVLANFTTAKMQRQTLAVYDHLLGSALVSAFDVRERME